MPRASDAGRWRGRRGPSVITDPDKTASSRAWLAFLVALQDGELTWSHAAVSDRVGPDGAPHPRSSGGPTHAATAAVDSALGADASDRTAAQRWGRRSRVPGRGPAVPKRPGEHQSVSDHRYVAGAILGTLLVQGDSREELLGAAPLADRGVTDLGRRLRGQSSEGGRRRGRPRPRARDKRCRHMSIDLPS